MCACARVRVCVCACMCSICVISFSHTGAHFRSSCGCVRPLPGSSLPLLGGQRPAPPVVGGSRSRVQTTAPKCTCTCTLCVRACCHLFVSSLFLCVGCWFSFLILSADDPALLSSAICSASFVTGRERPPFLFISVVIGPLHLVGALQYNSYFRFRLSVLVFPCPTLVVLRQLHCNFWSY